jgi:hypothetical protein
MQSNLLSGGIEQRFIGTTFSQETQSTLLELQKIANEKDSISGHTISEDDKLNQAIITAG